MKNFIELTLLNGEKVKLRVSSINVVIKKTNFDEDDIKRFPELASVKECSYIGLIGDVSYYRIQEHYEVVMQAIEQASH